MIAAYQTRCRLELPEAAHLGADDDHPRAFTEPRQQRLHRANRPERVDVVLPRRVAHVHRRRGIARLHAGVVHEEVDVRRGKRGEGRTAFGGRYVDTCSHGLRLLGFFGLI